MPATFSKAPAKTILFGEHAVVFGQPAIAIPVKSLITKVSILANPVGKQDEIRIIAPGIDFDRLTYDLPQDNYFVIGLKLIKDYLQMTHYPACEIRITSTIPIASGLGSSASVAVSLIKALFSFMGVSPGEESINDLAYQLEKVSHGNSSGIDNTVITFEKPIYFIREKPVEFVRIKRNLTIIIGNTGKKSLTKDAVAFVRERHESNHLKYNALIQEIGSITRQARDHIENGSIEKIGQKMTENHILLQELGVSSPELDRLVSTAIRAGATGAKLCGSGFGGNMVALVKEENVDHIASSLCNEGATQTYTTTIRAD